MEVTPRQKLGTYQTYQALDMRVTPAQHTPQLDASLEDAEAAKCLTKRPTETQRGAGATGKSGGQSPSPWEPQLSNPV